MLVPLPRVTATTGAQLTVLVPFPTMVTVSLPTANTEVSPVETTTVSFELPAVTVRFASPEMMKPIGRDAIGFGVVLSPLLWASTVTALPPLCVAGDDVCCRNREARSWAGVAEESHRDSGRLAGHAQGKCLCALSCGVLVQDDRDDGLAIRADSRSADQRATRHVRG